MWQWEHKEKFNIINRNFQKVIDKAVLSANNSISNEAKTFKR